MFKTQKSGSNASSGEIGLNIRTHASPKVGQDQVSRGVSILCLHAAPFAKLWKWLRFAKNLNIQKIALTYKKLPERSKRSFYQYCTILHQIQP